jgi:hypothetical protein
MISKLLRAVISSLAGHRQLALENLALRQQIAVLQRSAKRPHLKKRDRLFWVLLSRIWTNWAETLTIVKPETVIRWHRKGFRLYWTWNSRHKSGRPAVSREVRDLIRKMSKANSLWGAPRIPGELQKLGIDIAQATVSKYMIRHRKPPSQSWKTFLDNHVRDLVSIDFFAVPTVTFNVLFVFVVLTHDRRRVLHFNVTGSPTANWTAQQIAEAFPWETAPRYLLRDRDSIYGQEFTERVVVLNENHLRQLVRRYLSYYHGFRTHLSLEKDTPDMRPVEPPNQGNIVEIPMVGGLHHRYARRAA